jgi:hypothetical protein
MLVAMRTAFRINTLVVFEVHVPPANAVQRFVLDRTDCVVANSTQLAAILCSALPLHQKMARLSRSMTAR